MWTLGHGEFLHQRFLSGKVRCIANRDTDFPRRIFRKLLKLGRSKLTAWIRSLDSPPSALPDVFAMPIKVFLCDSSDVVRAGLFSFLDSTDGIDVVGQRVDRQEPLAQILELQPDVVILDFGATDSGRLEFIQNLQLESPGTKLLIFASKDRNSSASSSVQQLLAAGADGYLVKEVSGNEVVAAVRAVVAGRKIVSLSEFDNFFEKGVSRNDRSHSSRSAGHLDHASLSERECEVLSRLARGMTNQQVAGELFLSVKTIETYRSRLTKKIGARSRAELFEFASSAGMLSGNSTTA